MNQIINRLKSQAISGLKVLSLAFLFSVSSTVNAENVANGEKLFNDNCTSCHAINERITGPALKDVHKRRNEAWLMKWIRNSQDMVKSGDADAVAIFKEYNGTIMNSFANLSDENLKDLLAYIKSASEAQPVKPTDNKGDKKVSEEIGAKADGDGNVSGRINWVLYLIAFLILVIVILAFEILNLFGAYTGRTVIKWDNINAKLLLAFLIVGLAATVWEFSAHGKFTLTDNSSSEHGVGIDSMFNTTLILTGIVFVITQVLLFYYAFKYKKSDKRWAFYFPHNNKLEYIWTTIPAIALTFLILAGFKNWGKITDDSDPDPAVQKIEVFAYQFGWQARYPGRDGMLGKADFNLISPTNELGLGNAAQFDSVMVQTEAEIVDIEDKIKRMEGARKLNREQEAELYDLKDQLYRKKAHIRRLNVLRKDSTVFSGFANDDIIVKELHVPINEPILLKFRARDVIHSAYMPHFRLQMNAVPGLPTQFAFTPTKTTAQMKTELNDPKFEYWLICAKICGSSHFNMKMKVVVETRAEYEKWLASQKAYFAAPAEQAPADNKVTGEQTTLDSTKVKGDTTPVKQSDNLPNNPNQ